MINLELTSAQRQWRDEALRFADSSAPTARVRELAESQAPIDLQYLRGGAALGWYSCLVDGAKTKAPVQARGVAEAALVAECRGAGLQPGPVVPMTVVAMTLAEAGSPKCREVGDAIADGSATASWIWADDRGHWGDPPMRATRAGEGWAISGVSSLVQDGHQVDWLMIRAGTDEGERAFLVRSDAMGVNATRLESFDVTRAFARVTFDDVRVPGDSVVESPRSGEHLLEVAATLTVAESVGAMDRLLAVTVQYAKDRVAFGRPIGSFQAIKHLLADASVALETSKAMAAAAVYSLDHDRADADQIVSMAKAFVGEATREVVEACWQTHGGIAYTWAHEFHLFLRRLTTDASLYGDPTWHRSRLCRLNALVEA